MDSFNIYDMLDLLKITSSRNDILLEEKFPHLVPCKDSLYHARSVFNEYLGWDSPDFADINWLAKFLRYVKITNGKKFELNDKVKNVIGPPNQKNSDSYVYIYGCLFYPEDFISFSINVYVSVFNVLIKTIFKRNFDKELFKKDKRLYTLLEKVEELKTTYHKRFNNYTYQFLITLILSQCFINENYDILYNFLNDPKTYLDKLALRGYITYDNEHKPGTRYLWNKAAKERAYLNANSIFSLDEKTSIL